MLGTREVPPFSRRPAGILSKAGTGRVWQSETRGEVLGFPEPCRVMFFRETRQGSLHPLQ
jgi:hypothetical protein